MFYLIWGLGGSKQRTVAESRRLARPILSIVFRQATCVILFIMYLTSEAVIAPDKLTRYLLVPKKLNDKSRWLGRAGYTLENWPQLESDIRCQVLSREAIPDGTNSYGDMYRIVCALSGPNGRTIHTVTIWMHEYESGVTKFITMYPA